MSPALILLTVLLLAPLAAPHAAAATFFGIATRPNILHLSAARRVYRGRRRWLFHVDDSFVNTLARMLFAAVLFGSATAHGSDSGTPPDSAAVNLATTRCGAFVLASSFRHLTTQYPDNLLDNDATTSWQAWDHSFPQWIEVRWPHPVRVSAVHLDAVSPSSITAASVRGRRGGRWQDLADVKGENAGSSVRFEESEVDRLRIDLLAGDGGPATLAAVRVTGPDQPILRAIEPYWNAWYVWFPEPDRVHKTRAHHDTSAKSLMCLTRVCSSRRSSRPGLTTRTRCMSTGGKSSRDQKTRDWSRYGML